MATFSVTFSFKGKTASVTEISYETTKATLLSLARKHLDVSDDIILKLLYKGKIIAQDTNSDAADEPAFSQDVKISNNTAKVIVMGTAAKGIEVLNSQRSDPLLRGFDQVQQKKSPASFWGVHGQQHKEYKFCRLQECTDASFGTRPGASTPHAFEARRLLERLAGDPGIIAILTSRELVVGTLGEFSTFGCNIADQYVHRFDNLSTIIGEMDPIDDRLMQKKQQEGACLLGYNTNHGMRIDVKLRTDDLSSFRPYSELASTLIHELSHNWVGEHNILFWTNYANMRCEYLWKHALLMSGGDFVNGKRTAELAEVVHMISGSGKVNTTLVRAHLMEHIYESVIQETAREMAQHYIPVQMIANSVLEFTKDLMKETRHVSSGGGRKLGGSNDGNGTTLSVKELALAAAERRAREEAKKRNEMR